MFFPNNQLRQTAPINPNPHTHHTITYQTAEPQGQGVLRWAIRGGTKGGTQRGAEFSSLVACVWRVPFLGRFSDLVKRCETCTSLALRVSLYISFTNCRRNGWADEHYRWLWNFKIYLSSPVSPKTLQSMSFAEEDVKGTLAEGSQQMSRVYGRGKIGLAIYSTAEGRWRIIFKGRFLIWSYIWLLAPRFFSSTIDHCLRDFACWFRWSMRNFNASKRYPASFKTPLLNFLASALREYFFSNPIQSSSSHPAEKRGLSPYNGNGNPWNHPGVSEKGSM